MFSANPSVVSFLRANKRSEQLSKSAGAAAGNHNLRPLSNHSNYTILCLVVSCFFSLPFSCATVYMKISSHHGLWVEAFGRTSTLNMLCMLVPCSVGVCKNGGALFCVCVVGVGGCMCVL